MEEVKDRMEAKMEGKCWKENCGICLLATREKNEQRDFGIGGFQGTQTTAFWALRLPTCALAPSSTCASPILPSSQSNTVLRSHDLPESAKPFDLKPVPLLHLLSPWHSDHYRCTRSCRYSSHCLRTQRNPSSDFLSFGEFNCLHLRHQLSPFHCWASQVYHRCYKSYGTVC